MEKGIKIPYPQRDVHVISQLSSAKGAYSEIKCHLNPSCDPHLWHLDVCDESELLRYS